MLQKVNELIKRLEAVENQYKPIPFWSWNGKLEKDELVRQIRWMRETHNGGFFMHARAGLGTEYMSEDWFDCVDVCIDEAKKRGMEAWAYDENGFPSGFVGGKLLEKTENRDYFLTYSIGRFDPSADLIYSLANSQLQWLSESFSLKLNFFSIHINISATSIFIHNAICTRSCNYCEAFKRSI